MQVPIVMNSISATCCSAEVLLIMLVLYNLRGTKTCGTSGSRVDQIRARLGVVTVGEMVEMGGDVNGDVSDMCSKRLLHSYMQNHGMVRHQLESFDRFVQHTLPFIIEENSDVSHIQSNGLLSHHLHLTNLTIRPPSVTESDGFDRPLSPTMSRLRALTYASAVTVDVAYDVVDREAAEPSLRSRTVYRGVAICRIPVMVKSVVCSTYHSGASECDIVPDPGGYFIVNGIDKCIIAQAKLRTNHAFVFPSRLGKFAYVCEVRSAHEQRLRSTSTLCMHITDVSKGARSIIMVELPFVTIQVPLVALFRILGLVDIDEILEMVDCSSKDTEAMLRTCLECDSRSTMGTDEIIDWIGREGTTEPTAERRQRYMQHIIGNEIIPHMSLHRSPEGLRRKATFVAHMVRRLTQVAFEGGDVDDRDDFVNRRIDCSGVLMALLFRQLYRNFMRTLSGQLRKVIESNRVDAINVGALINCKKISSGFKYAFASGNWGVNRGGGVSSGGQTGVVQMMGKMTTVAAIAGLRRINTPISREGRAVAPRQLHSSTWGLLCPAETPEGGQCGLVTNLSLLTHVRVGSPSAPLASFILAMPSVHAVNEPGVSVRGDRSVSILVNGAIIGSTCDCDAVAAAIRSARRAMDVPFDVSVGVARGCIFVTSDAGCALRPLIVADRVVDYHRILQSSPASENVWQTMLHAGIIEYIDKQEELNMRVAIDPSHIALGYFSHMEIHGTTLLGLCTSLIPFSHHNQAPRNVYQSAMGKQAVGVMNSPHAMDSVVHALGYSQKALVVTDMDAMVGSSDSPSGMCPIVAIMCYSGYNQEDSLVASRSAIDRGLFRSFVYNSYKDEEKVIGADTEKFAKPGDACEGMRDADYSPLEENGFPLPGRSLSNGDAIIGKVASTTRLQASGVGEKRRDMQRDRSTILRSDEPSVVDAVFRSTTTDGNGFVRIRTRAMRIPGVGDKLSSRHGQKGIVGSVLADCDMPFTSSGIVPDLIVNPHAIPSRMTIGQLVECLTGKLGCVKAELMDGTPFRDTSIEAIADELERLGYNRSGNEEMYNGMTGERLPGMVFIGPTFYQRLKHMVGDKCHGRGRGPVQLLSRQPVEGRSREGGLRCGEMERDCFIAHGATAVLRDRLFEQADPFSTSVCSKCGLLCVPAPDPENSGVTCGVATCRNCKESDCKEMQMPYAFKLLTHELYGMCIAPRLRFVPD